MLDSNKAGGCIPQHRLVTYDHPSAKLASVVLTSDQSPDRQDIVSAYSTRTFARFEITTLNRSPAMHMVRCGNFHKRTAPHSLEVVPRQVVVEKWSALLGSFASQNPVFIVGLWPWFHHRWVYYRPQLTSCVSPTPAATLYTLPIIPTELSLNPHYKATPTPLAPVVSDSVPRWCAIPTHRQLTAR